MAHKNKDPRSLTEEERIERFVRFVVFFNKFINHARKPRKQFVEKDMRM